MKTNNSINVLYEGKKVGTLALMSNRKVAFEYSDEWIETGFAISPFALPLKKMVFVAQKDYFKGLHGVFADSLPDAWGQLLLNRMLKSKGYNLDEINVLDRLAIVGSSGMGALTYEPENMIANGQAIEDLDELADSCYKILNTEYSERLELHRNPSNYDFVEINKRIYKPDDCYQSYQCRSVIHRTVYYPIISDVKNMMHCKNRLINTYD